MTENQRNMQRARLCALLKLDTDDADAVIDEIVSLRAELERVKKQSAAMRKAMSAAASAAGCTWLEQQLMLAGVLHDTDAGRDYISREQVKPLVKALEELNNMLAMRGPGDNPYAVVRRALEHARALNL